MHQSSSLGFKPFMMPVPRTSPFHVVCGVPRHFLLLIRLRLLPGRKAPLYGKPVCFIFFPIPFVAHNVASYLFKCYANMLTRPLPYKYSHTFVVWDYRVAPLNRPIGWEPRYTCLEKDMRGQWNRSVVGMARPAYQPPPGVSKSSFLTRDLDHPV